MALKYQIPSWIQVLYRGVTWRGDRSRKVVYLTFDDGPIPEVTPQLLDILKQENVPATFFVVGENAKKHPELLQREMAEGHRVGNHTYNHLKGWNCSLEEYLHNTEMSLPILGHAVSLKPLFRPPYGKITNAQKKALLAKGYQIVLWDILTHDYDATYSPEKMLEIVQQHVRNGSIINFHDSIKSGKRTLLAVPQVIAWLKQQGYEFETL